MKADKNIEKIGILAGAGHLPKHVYEACIERNIECKVIAFEEQTNTDFFPPEILEVFQLHNIGKIVKSLKKSGIKYLVLAGRVQRTSISKLLLDLKGAKLFTKIIKKGLNDNAILSSVLEFLEQEGFTIVSPDSLLPDNLIVKGAITKVKPDASAKDDIKKGFNILKGIAQYDIGQGLIIQAGLILGVEAAEGTDELIRRCGEIKQADEDKPILIKMSKPNQDKRVDLPCIGPHTIENLHKYGIRGVALESGSSFIIEKSNCVQVANKLGIFIYGI